MVSDGLGWPRIASDGWLAHGSRDKVNLAGLGGNDVVRRRTKCLEAALIRFVSKDTPAMLPQRRGTKRKMGHGAAVRDVLVEMTGTVFIRSCAAMGGR